MPNKHISTHLHEFVSDSMPEHSQRFHIHFCTQNAPWSA